MRIVLLKVSFHLVCAFKTIAFVLFVSRSAHLFCQLCYALHEVSVASSCHRHIRFFIFVVCHKDKRMVRTCFISFGALHFFLASCQEAYNTIWFSIGKKQRDMKFIKRLLIVRILLSLSSSSFASFYLLRRLFSFMFFVFVRVIELGAQNRKKPVIYHSILEILSLKMLLLPYWKC